MRKIGLLLLAVCIGSFWTISETARLVHANVKPASSAAVSIAKRSRNVAAPRVRHSPVHPILHTVRQRAVLVTKAGATIAGPQRVSTHATSLAPPVHGGPSIFSTRAVRTTSATSTIPLTTSAGTTTGTAATSTPTTDTSTGVTTAASSSTSTSAVTVTSATTTATSSTAATSTSSTTTSSSTTSVPTSTASTTTASTPAACTACSLGTYNRCTTVTPVCNGQCCNSALSCKPSTNYRRLATKWHQ